MTERVRLETPLLRPDPADRVGRPGAVEDAHEHGDSGIFGGKTELIFSLLCGVLLAVGLFAPGMIAVPAWLPLSCYIAAYACGGFFTVREAVASLRYRRFEIDSGALSG